MRKLKLIALAVVFLMFLTSCFITPNSEKPHSKDTVKQGIEEESKAEPSNEFASIMFAKILDAISQKEADRIKDLFSKQALMEAKDIDSSIEYLFNLLDGEVVSWEMDRSSIGETSKRGKYSRLIRSWFTVHTEKSSYLFFILDYNRNTIEPDLLGLYTLRGINEEDAATQWGDWVEMRIPGVYMPE